MREKPKSIRVYKGTLHSNNNKKPQHFFFKGKGNFKYLNTGYCFHVDHELKNIKIVFWISAQTWPTFSIPHDIFVLL